ncbi:helix-turn-helix domain-containing protein [Caulobacter segnis]
MVRMREPPNCLSGIRLAFLHGEMGIFATMSANLHTPNWNDLRVLLHVARAGGLMAAGRRLGLDQTTVARRITALETDLGVKLIDTAAARRSA